MATVQTYIDEINTAIAAEPLLADLSTSNAAEWIALRNAIASHQFNAESFWEAYSVELDLRGKQINIGTLAWFADKALEYQDGDALSVVNGVPQYPIINLTKRIIKHVAISETGEGRVILKVATIIDDEYAALTQGINSQMSRFISYINKLKIPGVKTGFISQDSDLVKLYATIKYDGERDLTAVKLAVKNAINAYLKGIFFNGEININLLRDAIEKLPEVVQGGVTINELAVKAVGNDYVIVTTSLLAVSGHYKLDEAFDIDNTITYITG